VHSCDPSKHSSRTLLRETADALKRLGPFALYSEAFTHGASGVETEALEPSRGALVAATRVALLSLWAVRDASRHKAPPRELRPPGPLQRHSLFWLGLLALLGYGWVEWLQKMPELTETALRAGLKVAADLQRFWRTHVTEPIQGIKRELFHGYEHTIDPQQVVQTRESLKRMLEEFVRDTHPEFSGTADLDEALQRASQGSMEPVLSAYEQQVKRPISSLASGQLLRSMLLFVQQMRLLMEEEVEAIDSLLKRNDFNLQVMATVPALCLVSALVFLFRTLWRKLRSSDRALRDPIEAIQADVMAIDALLTRAEGAPSLQDAIPRFQRGALSQFEATPMELSAVGEIVFRVQRLRASGSQWLRGLVREELIHDAQVLLDSGRLSAMQRSRIAESLLRRLDNVNGFKDHW